VKFQKGDLVMVICQTADHGKIGTVTASCDCLTGLLSAALIGKPYYRIESLGSCYREDALKKIGGDGNRTETQETRDAPVAA
jgi:hypothetical protein